MSLSDAVLSGLLAIHRYRLLTADQFARIAQLHVVYARDQLRTLERKKLLGSIGNVGLRGGSKAPKLYFLTRTGYAAMADGSGLDTDALGPFVKPHTSTKWSPVMAHRVGTIDLLVAAEAALAGDPAYCFVAALHEYRRVGRGPSPAPETSDQITDDRPDRIVPDGAFIIENTATLKRGLYFVECDRGTERITSDQDAAYSITEKFAKYERYLQHGRFAKTYARFGDFSFATILFATTTPTRIDNIRAAASTLDPALHGYFRLTTFDAAKADLFGTSWLNRDPNNADTKPLLKGRSTS